MLSEHRQSRKSHVEVLKDPISARSAKAASAKDAKPKYTTNDVESVNRERAPSVPVNMTSGPNNSNSWACWSEAKNMLAQVILHDF